MGLHSLRPYKPVLQSLSFKRADDAMILLEQTGLYQETLEALATLNLHGFWHLRFYRMVTPRTPTAPFNPKEAWVEQLGAEVSVWPVPTKRREGRTVPGTPPPASDAACEAAAPAPASPEAPEGGAGESHEGQEPPPQEPEPDSEVEGVSDEEDDADALAEESLDHFLSDMIEFVEDVLEGEPESQMPGDEPVVAATTTCLCR